MPKLKEGDKIAILALSKAINPKDRNPEIQNQIEHIFKSVGLTPIFYSSCFEQKYLNCSNIQTRITDFHDAIKDPTIKAIMCARGGRNSNQLLSHIDFNLIKKNPKYIIGYSDITTLLNAIYTKIGIKTYHGPMIIDIINKTQPSLSKLKKIIDTQSTEINLSESRTIQKGKAEGILIGGNLTSFMHLSGTEYFPELNNKIIFLEDTLNVTANARDRALHQLGLQQGAKYISGILLAKTGEGHGINIKLWQKIFSQIPELHNTPILANLNFGHIKNAEPLIIAGEFNFTAK